MSTFKINKGVVDNLESSLSGKSSTDLDNLSQTGEAHFANSALSNSPYTTNRILEIPQDIKLELNDGVLTLKAGSKVYVPNGFEEDGVTPKFDALTITEDKTVGTVGSVTGPSFLLYDYTNSTLIISNVPTTASGESLPSGFSGIFYNTTTNIISGFSGGTSDNHSYSLTIGLYTRSSGVPTSIDQIFNGFGYIGSHIFTFPGVKVQTPDGRNVDGTYKSIERIISTVKTYDAGAWGTANLNVLFTGPEHNINFQCQAVNRFTYNKKISSGTITFSYDENTGIWWYSGDQSSWVTFSNNIVGFCRVESKKITQFQVETVDSVANSNASNFSQAGRSYLSGLGMPSGKYIDLTLLASGNTYTAPANGYFCLAKKSTATGQSIYMGANGGSAPSMTCAAYNSTGHVQCFVPCKKGTSCQVRYDVAGETAWFRFVYTEGENS